MNLEKPGFPCESCGASFILVMDVFLLDLDPMVTEAASKQVGPSNVIVGRDQKIKGWFAAVGSHVKKRAVLQRSTLDVNPEDRLKVWLVAQSLASSLRDGLKEFTCH